MTVKTVVPETDPRLAVMVADPRVLPVATPFEPVTLLMEATAAFSEAQMTEAVRSCVEPSANVPVAFNCNVEPSPMLGLAGVTAMEDSALTVSTVEPVAPNVALIVLVPDATAVASPLDPEALLMVATALFDELQDTSVVRSRTEPSGKVPVAVNCWVAPATALGVAGVTEMDVGP